MLFRVRAGRHARMQACKLFLWFLFFHFFFDNKWDRNGKHCHILAVMKNLLSENVKIESKASGLRTMRCSNIGTNNVYKNAVCTNVES